MTIVAKSVLENDCSYSKHLLYTGCPVENGTQSRGRPLE